jgi:hypothetical protein
LAVAAAFTLLPATAPTTTTPATSPPPAQYPHPGTTDPDPAMHLPTYSKKAVTIAKIYMDNQKYNGVSNNFDFKLTIFYDICKRSSLPPKGHMIVFPIILKGLAQVYYYNYNIFTK